MNSAAKMVSDFSKVSASTTKEFHSHLITRDWTPNQFWSWYGGDAIVTMTGSLPSTQVYVTLRIGKTVKTVAARGLVEALRWEGIEMDGLVIRTKAKAA
jgi:roadblock/LC7 domain-containing protein